MKKICYIGAAIMAVAILLILVIGLFNPDTSDNTDLNLKSFKISELTDETIVSVDSDFKAFMTRTGRSGSRSGIDSLYFMDVDGDKTEYSAKKITGVNTVSATLAKDCTLVLNIDTTLEAGNAEVVVIMDDEIVNRFNAGDKKVLEYKVNGEHMFYVRILCEKAKISITTTRGFK